MTDYEEPVLLANSLIKKAFSWDRTHPACAASKLEPVRPISAFPTIPEISTAHHEPRRSDPEARSADRH